MPLPAAIVRAFLAIGNKILGLLTEQRRSINPEVGDSPYSVLAG